MARRRSPSFNPAFSAGDPRSTCFTSTPEADASFSIETPSQACAANPCDPPLGPAADAAAVSEELQRERARARRSATGPGAGKPCDFLARRTKATWRPHVQGARHAHLSTGFTEPLSRKRTSHDGRGSSAKRSESSGGRTRGARKENGPARVVSEDGSRSTSAAPEENERRAPSAERRGAAGAARARSAREQREERRRETDGLLIQRRAREEEEARISEAFED